MFDVVVALIAAAVPLALGILGVWVTLRPPATKKHAGWIALFVVVGIGGCLCSGIIAYRTGEQLTRIEKNTGNPPNITVQPPAVIVNAPPDAPRPRAVANVVQMLMVSAYKPSGATDPRVGGVWLIPDKDVLADIFFINSGSARAEDVKGWSEIYFMPSDPNKPDEEKVAEKTRDAKMLASRFVKSSAEHLKGAQVGEIDPNPNAYFWFTGRSERTVTQDDIDKLRGGGELLFIFYNVQYRDTSGFHYIRGCRTPQPPAFSPEVWQFCGTFEESR
jgi:hypothetical protein